MLDPRVLLCTSLAEAEPAQGNVVSAAIAVRLAVYGMRSKIVKGKIIPAGKLESDSEVESEASSCRQTGSKIAKVEVQCGLVAAKKVKVEKIDNGPAVKKLKADIKSECKTVKKRTPGKKSSGQTSVRVVSNVTNGFSRSLSRSPGQSSKGFAMPLSRIWRQTRTSKAHIS